jgi:hypothetical protein
VRRGISQAPHTYTSLHEHTLSAFKVLSFEEAAAVSADGFGDDEVRNLSQKLSRAGSHESAELEVAKRNQASEREPPWQTIHRVR